MKMIMQFFLTFVVISILLSCNRENSAEPAAMQEVFNTDTVFTDIDTTLHIQTTKEGELTFYQIDRYKTLVVKIPRISSYLFLKNPTKSLRQIALDSNYSLIVNASYFDFIIKYGATDTTRTFVHAGYLKIGDTVYENIKDDRQLTKIFAYDSKKNIVNYFNLSDLWQAQEYDLVVQIGPQIIRKNVLDSASINASFNGNLPWPRTTFASVNGKEFYIIVNLGFAPVTLLELGAMLRTSGIFKKDLDIINFDGGFSTSLYVKNHPEFCTYPDNKMPLLIGVK